MQNSFFATTTPLITHQAKNQQARLYVSLHIGDRGAQRIMTNTSKTTNFVLYLHKILCPLCLLGKMFDVGCRVLGVGAIELFKYTELSCGTS